MSFAVCYAPTTVYRVGYDAVDKLAPWQYVGSGRFDDPQRAFRVLYTSLTKKGAYTERFQDFRPSSEFAEAEAEFERDDSIEGAPIESPSGTLPFADLARLFIGRLQIPQDAELLDLTQDESARYFSLAFRRNLTVADFIADATYEICPRISRVGYADSRHLAGIYSASQIAPVEVQNVTLYEGVHDSLRVSPFVDRRESVSHDDPDLRTACDELGVRIESPEDFYARQFSQHGF